MRSLTAANGVAPLPDLDVPSEIRRNSGADVEMAGAQDTIYLCNFRVSVDGEWLCLKELHDIEMQDSFTRPNENGAITSPDDPMHSLMGNLNGLVLYHVCARGRVFFIIMIRMHADVH